MVFLLIPSPWMLHASEGETHSNKESLSRREIIGHSLVKYPETVMGRIYIEEITRLKMEI